MARNASGQRVPDPLTVDLITVSQLRGALLDQVMGKIVAVVFGLETPRSQWRARRTAKHRRHWFRGVCTTFDEPAFPPSRASASTRSSRISFSVIKRRSFEEWRPSIKGTILPTSVRELWKFGRRMSWNLSEQS
jgi:hypothetical protein